MRTGTLIATAVLLFAAAPSQAQQTSPAATPPAAPSAPAPALPPWHQRFTVRGYVQLRYSDVSQGDGAILEVPADRSVNPNESFMLRRGRVVLSGDITERAALYAQADLNASTGSGDYSAQLRDLYADVALDNAKEFRLRLGQSKVPFGWSNLQSSQNRAPLERADAINSAAEGERDIGVTLMWAPAEVRNTFRDLVSQGLKGSGDYGVVALGLYSGQGLNRSDQNGDPHVVARWSRPFKLASGQLFEIGVQAYDGDFVVQTQPITVNGTAVTPSAPVGGTTDRRVGVSAIWYPQPFGVEMEWNTGEGPVLSSDFSEIVSDDLDGGYVQFTYRHKNAASPAVWVPFMRWQHYSGGRKFGRNAPLTEVDEWEVGVEFAPRAELEFVVVYARTDERTRTSAFPYTASLDASRIGLQLQWNY
jgi:hypothetical protein